MSSLRSATALHILASLLRLTRHSVATAVCVLALIPSGLAATTNDLSGLLQKGLFEEEANRNLDAAAQAYQTVSAQFDKDRQLAATAIFRLGEIYRKQNKTNEAAGQYERIVREFADQTTLVTLSRQNLAGLAANRASMTTSGQVAPTFSATDAELFNRLKSLSRDQLLQVFPSFLPDPVLTELQKELNSTDAKLLEARQNYSEQHPEVQRLTEMKKLLVKKIDERLTAAMIALEIRANLAKGNGASTPTGKNSNDAVTTVQDDEEKEIRRIQTLIQNSPDLINATGENGTPLARAANNGWLSVATFLLDHGAEVNAGGIPALNEAANAGNRAMVELLLSRGANVNSKGGLGKTPLHIAAEKNYPSVIEVLLANKADVNAWDNLGRTLLGTAVASRQVATVQKLLASGANPHVEDSTGRTPLSYAAGSGSSETVKLLLEAKADPNAGKLDVPLLSAINNKDTASAELLLQAGANPNAKTLVNWPLTFGNSSYPNGTSITPMFLAVSTRQLPMVNLLLEYKADPNDTQTDGRSLLFSALPYPEILETLILAGGKVEVSVPDVGSLLAAAINVPSLPAVEILLKHGANPNTHNGDSTPLQIAVVRANVGAVTVLLKYKTEVNSQNAVGKTPLDLASAGLTGRVPTALLYASADNSTYGTDKQKQQEIVNLLTKAGGRTNLPQFDRITVNRLSANFSQVVFQKGTNDWNRFSLLETILNFYRSQNSQQLPSSLENARPYMGKLAFPDLERVTIIRHQSDATNEIRITVNLLNSTNGIDCTKNMPLEFGDVVELPERDHALGDRPVSLTGSQFAIINDYLSGSVQLEVRGQKVGIPIQSWAASSRVGVLIHSSEAQKALLSSSDLSQVKVTRNNPKTGKKQEWIVDCSAGKAPDLWLRDGDVVEVPDKP